MKCPYSAPASVLLDLRSATLMRLYATIYISRHIIGTGLYENQLTSKLASQRHTCDPITVV